MSLEGKVALVTGGARGIGEGISKCLADAGVKIAVADLDDDNARKVAEALPTESIGVLGDAADEGSMTEVVRHVVGELGSLEIVVNNAGVGGPNIGVDATEVPLLEMTDEQWDEQLRTNLRTTFATTKAAVPHLGRGASIVNIASIAGISTTPDLPAYGAAKAGVVHLTRTQARALAPRGIRVNVICPGVLWTRAWELLTARMQAQNPELAQRSGRQIFEEVVRSIVPLGAEQTPEDIGQLTTFLASDAARNITGQVISVDGGITLGGPVLGPEEES